jgi:hypothetical protein
MFGRIVSFLKARVKRKREERVVPPWDRAPWDDTPEDLDYPTVLRHDNPETRARLAAAEGKS